MTQELRDQIYEQLEEVIDPELGIDIVNLGLVYDVIIDEDYHAYIKMTMTSMGCPLAGQIIAEAKSKLITGIPDLKEVEIDIVWSPPWTKDLMSRYAKIALGVHN